MPFLSTVLSRLLVLRCNEPNKSKNHTNISFITVLGFAENRIVFWDFKIQNSIQIIEGSDYGNLDNQASNLLC